MSSETALDGATVPVDPYDARVIRFSWDDALDAGVAIADSRFEVIGVKPSPVRVASITRSGAVMTVLTDEDHDLATGGVVTVAGADQAEYNVTGTITVTTARAFTMSVSGTPASPATGDVLSVSQGLGFDSPSILTTAGYDSRATLIRLLAKGPSYLGRRYEVANRITTDESPTQTKERSFFVVIENL